MSRWAVVLSILIAGSACAQDPPAPTPTAAPAFQSRPGAPEPTAGAAEPAPPQPAAPAEPTVEFAPCPPPLPPKAVPPGMRVTLGIAKPVWGTEETVSFVLNVRNEGQQTTSRSWTTEDRDIWVDRHGETIFRLGRYHERGGGAPGTRTYGPGEASDPFPGEWPLAVCDGTWVRGERHPPGTYTARGYAQDGDGAWYSNEVRFEVR